MKTIRAKIIKKVEDAVIHKVPKIVYNTVRSFVESSPKPEYRWNVGIRIGNTVKFVKEGKWVLEVAEKAEIPEPEHVTGTVVATLDDAVSILAARDGRLLLQVSGVTDDDGAPKLFSVDDIFELRKHYIIAEVPFAYPISLADIWEKVQEYVEFEFEEAPQQEQ